MRILGISAFYHDAAAALIEDGRVRAAAQEERFSRIKHDPEFPAEAIAYCLREANVTLSELDAVVFYDKPFLKFERILQTVLETAPRGLPLFLKSMPVWLKEKLFLKGKLKSRLREMGLDPKSDVPLLFSSHHLSHAASAFFASPFEEAAILTVDGVGEWATASVAHGQNAHIRMLKEMAFPHSLGLLYTSFTYFLGFKVNEGEYKVMGLAPYADPDDPLVKKYHDLLTAHLVTIHPDGSLNLNGAYFSYTHAPVMIPEKKWERLFGLPKRSADDPLQKEHAALALALQRVTEESVLRMADYARQLTGSSNLCLAGGVALNCVANGKLLESGRFRNIYVQPAAGDAGGALGAALAVYHLHLGQPRVPETDFMGGCALGPRFSDAEIEESLRAFSLASEKREPDARFYEECARYLAEGNVLGWFSGRMEFGPRALGHRSILGDAAYPDMQTVLNLKIKKRESFRPFAPVMLEEELDRYFDAAVPNGYMLFVHAIKPELRRPRPGGYYALPFREMLSHPGSELPAITHIDYTARIQTVSPGSGAGIRLLLQAFKKITGRGVLVNTSFNVKDEPIVCTPSDAIRCFLQTEMDILVLENHLIKKNRTAPR